LVDKIIATRELAGVHSENRFIFGSPAPREKCLYYQYLSCKDVLKDVKMLVELDGPDRISTR
jgi:hypothetical protein